ncbi:MAG: hypothetical protein JWR01_1107, partial [Subtercola sp.]|nr:hypothetical protein [Subtercola sp.]
LHPPSYLRLVIIPTYTGGTAPTTPATVLAVTR